MTAHSAHTLNFFGDGGGERSSCCVSVLMAGGGGGTEKLCSERHGQRDRPTLGATSQSRTLGSTVTPRSARRLSSWSRSDVSVWHK
jgi:hypothetical protein